jgi:hypothetical protein
MVKRLGFLPALVLAAGGLAAGLGGCELIATVDRSQIAASGGGATTSSTTDSTTSTTTSSTTSSTSTGMMCPGGAMACAAPGDCPTPTSECVDRTCDMGCCGTADKADGVAIGTQSAGDCQKTVCDGKGATKQIPDDTDPPAPMDDCHKGTCTNGTPGQAIQPTGTTCMLTGGGSGVCGDTSGSNAGKCVECNATADCTGSKVCDTGNQCVDPSCTDNMKDGSETDKDCGGSSCPPCANSLKCGVDADCQSLNCNGGTCAAASCTDTKQDGTETDVDCGGATCDGQNKTCADNKKCATNADCTNGYCDTSASPKVCKTPTCMDGVQNGNESDVDCGATCGSAKLCATGSKCGSAADCQSGVCDGTKHCATLADGAACTGDAQCAHGNCVANGGSSKICCATACSGTCLACSTAFTGVADGTCADVTAGHAPAASSQCAVTTTCGNTGVCAANHTCAQASTSVACSGTSCVAGASSYTFNGQATCDGSGTCGSPPAGVDCGTFGCGATGCKAACTVANGTADCGPNRTCVAGSPNKCLLNNGQACSMSSDCASNTCMIPDGGTTGTCM